MVKMEEKMKIIENLFDDCIRFETEDTLKQEKKEKFLKTLAGELNKENLIYAISHLNPKTYSKERFLELCIEKNVLDKELLSSLFIHVHTMGHLYHYFRDYNKPFVKQLDFFSKINIPFTYPEAKIDKLPETFKIFRGMYEKPTNIEECGFCWTLCESKAKEFALCRPPNNNGFVIKGTVKRDDIFGYITARDEEEIVVNPQIVANKEVYEVWKQ
jgi:hypothetical protein